MKQACTSITKQAMVLCFLLIALTGQTQPLAAVIGQYPGSEVTPPTGQVKIDFTKDQLRLYYQLENMERMQQGGIHIHTGDSCDDAGKVGGHYWHPMVVAEDQWHHALWHSNAQGVAKGALHVATGTSYHDNLNRAVVVHNSQGKRIGCGILKPVNN